jgi:hypothetical protein
MTRDNATEKERRLCNEKGELSILLVWLGSSARWSQPDLFLPGGHFDRLQIYSGAWPIFQRWREVGQYENHCFELDSQNGTRRLIGAQTVPSC